MLLSPWTTMTTSTLSHQSNNITLLEDSTLLFPLGISDKIYFGKYYYRVAVKGNMIFYDIALHNKITVYLKKRCGFKNRSMWSTKYRYIFFDDYDAVVEFTTLYKNVVLDITGPWDQVHFENLHKDQQGFYVPVIRDKLYYSKFDVRIEFDSLGHYLYKTGKYTQDPEIRQQYSNQLLDLVDQNTTDHLWLGGYGKYRTNILYVLKEDADMLIPIISIAQKDRIDLVQHVILTPKI